MSIFKVLSNLNHNGVAYKAGQFIEEDLATFETLVADKVLAVVEGAESVVHAAELDAKREAQAKADAEAGAAAETAVAPKNTWEPAKEEEVKAPEAPAATETAPEKKEGGFLAGMFGAKPETAPAAETTTTDATAPVETPEEKAAREKAEADAANL